MSSNYWQYELSLSLWELEELERMVVLSICEVASKRPSYSSEVNYLYKVGKNVLLKLLFRGNGWLVKSQQNKTRTTFIEFNLAKIYNLLLDSRNKRGLRGNEAALRDSQLILLASLGWNNKQIGEELNLNPDHVKKYRQSIVKRLEKIHANNHRSRY